LSVGVLAIVATWLFFGPLEPTHAQVWQAFIAWGAHYHCGGKIKGTTTAAICMSWGAVVGMLSVLLAGQLGALGEFAAPVAVGIGAAVIVLSSKLGFLAAIPASVYGFASIAGLWLLGGTGVLGADATVVDALLPTVIAVVVGALFGIVSETLAGALTKK
jgi:hypothetical protein